MKTEPIIPFSLSFTAGVAAASCIRGGQYSGIAVLCAIFLTAGICLQTRRMEGTLLMVTVFLAGLYSALSRSLPLPPSGSANPPLAHLSISFREGFRSLTSDIPFRDERTAPLINALLCGDRSALSPGMVESFRKSGASHLLALSGLHLGVLATGLGTILNVLGNSRKAQGAKSVIIISFCLLYLAACGAGPSLQRAFLFITIRRILHHDHSRRLSTAGTLCCALTIQLAIDPLSIRSVSFQLSYLAMAGITFILPRLEAFYPDEGRRHDPIRKLWKSMAMSVSCQIPTLPLVWIKFHSIPHCFILTNLISLPLCEILVSSAALLTVMSALGFRPQALITVVDTLSRILLRAIGIISEM